MGVVMSFATDFFTWNKEKQLSALNEITTLFRKTYDTLNGLFEIKNYADQTWALKKNTKDTEQQQQYKKDYQEAKNIIHNRTENLLTLMETYLKFLDPHDEEELKIKQRLLRTQKGLIE